MDRNVRLLVAYDGAEFHGWQTQPGLRTVQDVLEASLRRVVRHDVQLIGSGRTDAGVHAAGQVANFRTTCAIPADRLKHAIGARLPDDVSVRLAADVSSEFHAGLSAISKLYRYCIHAGRERPVTQLAQRRRYHIWEPLDLAAMTKAAEHFLGERDFRAMAPASCRRESMVRTVFRCDVERHLDEIRIDVEGSGFLYNQVRNMVGTLIEVGRGRWPPEHVAGILASRDRRLAGPTAPAHGLCLQWVRYRPEALRPPDGQPLPDGRGSDNVPLPDGRGLDEEPLPDGRGSDNVPLPDGRGSERPRPNCES